MKQILRNVQKQMTLSVLFAFFTFTHLHGQYSENFEDYAVRDSFVKFGYVFQSATINNASNTVINGNRSLRVGPLSNPNGSYRFSSGFIYVDQTCAVGFKHRATNNSSSASVKLYLVDASNNAVDSSASFSAGPSAKTETVSFNGRTGWFRLRWSWKGNGGSAYGVLDDVTTNLAASSITGSTSYLADIQSFSRITMQRFGATDSVDMKFIFVNNGPDVARNGNATISLPAGFFKDNIILSNGTFTSANNRFSFSQLAVGDSATIIVRSRVINYGSFTINASFTGFDFQADPLGANNATSATYFGGTVLPVKLISFAAHASANNLVTLVWKTVQEESVLQYIIERGSDGTNFSPLNDVNARGIITESVYQFQDRISLANTAFYYRLKIIERSGGFTYSAVAKVVFGKSNELQISPNPFRSSLTLLLTSISSGQAQVVLRNAAGVQVQQVQQKLQAGTNQVQITGLDGLQSGIYFLSVQHGTETFTRQLLKN